MGRVNATGSYAQQEAQWEAENPYWQVEFPPADYPPGWQPGAGAVSLPGGGGDIFSSGPPAFNPPQFLGNGGIAPAGSDISAFGGLGGDVGFSPSQGFGMPAFDLNSIGMMLGAGGIPASPGFGELSGPNLGLQLGQGAFDWSGGNWGATGAPAESPGSINQGGFDIGQFGGDTGLGGNLSTPWESLYTPVNFPAESPGSINQAGLDIGQFGGDTSLGGNVESPDMWTYAGGQTQPVPTIDQEFAGYMPPAPPMPTTETPQEQSPLGSADNPIDLGSPATGNLSDRPPTQVQLPFTYSDYMNGVGMGTPFLGGIGYSGGPGGLEPTSSPVYSSAEVDSIGTAGTGGSAAYGRYSKAYETGATDAPPSTWTPPEGAIPINYGDLTLTNPGAATPSYAFNYQGQQYGLPWTSNFNIGMAQSLGNTSEVSGFYFDPATNKIVSAPIHPLGSGGASSKYFL